MSTRAELLEQLSLASKRVDEWPAWLKEMREQARHAELYLEQRDARVQSLDASPAAALSASRK